MIKMMTDKPTTYAGRGTCEICGEADPCAACGGSNDNGLLKEVNQMLINIMINHPYFESRKVADLNHKVCKKLQEERST
jgi:hypothetical protein